MATTGGGRDLGSAFQEALSLVGSSSINEAVDLLNRISESSLSRLVLQL